MKKILCMFLIICIVIGSIFANGSSEQPKITANSSEKIKADGMLWEVKPLDKKTHLTVSYLANGTAELVTYLAEEMGWLDACNIDVDMIYFAGGPAQLEATNSWDCGTTGIGGMVSGIVNYDIKTLGVVSLDRGLYQAFFARKDSDIVAAGKGHTSIPDLYGTAETWKGKNIITAIGTTNQYTLYSTLKQFGLNLSDVNVINMDIASTATAFIAGEGDVAGIQGFQIQDPELKKDKYVLVTSDQMLGCGLAVNYIANPKSYSEKKAAIDLWTELAIMAGEWANQNPEKAAEMMVEMYAIDGYETTKESNFTMITDNPFISLKDNYEFFTQIDPEFNSTVAEAQLFKAMSGYVEMGNYSQSQLDKVLSTNSFKSSPIVGIYESR